MFRVAHVSDLHATPARGALRALAGKRLLGWLSWRVRRRHFHRPEVLEALVADLAREAPDQVVVTGDLTNVAGEEEFPAARRWLERLGPPERVSLVPGNHDAYVRVAEAKGVGLWREWIESDVGAAAALAPGVARAAFPTLRLRGPLAIVGVSSALPTLPLLAQGEVGALQRERLEALLGALRDRFRVVLIHHPPEPGVVRSRRALRDAAELAGVFARAGAELVLHGHLHRQRVGQLAGPVGPIPVVCARSASDLGHRPETRSQYHVYEIEPAPGATPPWRVRMRVRGYDPASGAFAAEGERAL